MRLDNNELQLTEPMFTMKTILAAAFFILAGAAAAQDVSQQYMAERERIFAQREAGKLTPLETTIEIEAAGKAYFPNDLLLQAYNASIRGYAEQLQNGVITRERFLELHDQRSERFDTAVAERAGAVDRERAAADTQSRKAQGIGAFLSGMASSLNRAYPPAVTCSSTGMPGVVTTSCR